MIIARCKEDKDGIQRRMAAGRAYSRGFVARWPTDAEWKVKLIVSLTMEHRLPLSVSVPFPLLIGLLMVMLLWGD